MSDHQRTNPSHQIHRQKRGWSNIDHSGRLRNENWWWISWHPSRASSGMDLALRRIMKDRCFRYHHRIRYRNWDGLYRGLIIQSGYWIYEQYCSNLCVILWPSYWAACVSMKIESASWSVQKVKVPHFIPQKCFSFTMSHDELWYIEVFYAYATENNAHSHTKCALIDRTVWLVSTKESRNEGLKPTSVVSLSLIFFLVWNVAICETGSWIQMIWLGEFA